VKRGRERVEDDDDDEDEDDEDASCWLLPTASCRLATSVAAGGRDGFLRALSASVVNPSSPITHHASRITYHGALRSDRVVE